MNTEAINEVLDFWYAPDNAKKWFKTSPEFDLEITQRFESIWLLAADNKLNTWQQTPAGCLALCIVLDQFPLNMYRGTKKSFQTGSQSITIARAAISKGFDDDIDTHKVSFLYMPLMHSEVLQDHDLCVTCFEKRKLEDNVRYAKHHRSLVAEFGRFPHRNKTLERENTAEEVLYLDSKRAFKG